MQILTLAKSDLYKCDFAAVLTDFFNLIHSIIQSFDLPTRKKTYSKTIVFSANHHTSSRGSLRAFIFQTLSHNASQTNQQLTHLYFTD